ncbi:hypothetical protein AB5I41_24175 [Sphingomonas sp. MMS24-JH45]
MRMTMAEYETILAEKKKGDALVVTLNRPERLNAASIQMAGYLHTAFYDLQGARAVLVTGGSGVLLGADLPGARLRQRGEGRGREPPCVDALLQSGRRVDAVVAGAGGDRRERPGGGRRLLDRACG